MWYTWGPGKLAGAGPQLYHFARFLGRVWQLLAHSGMRNFKCEPVVFGSLQQMTFSMCHGCCANLLLVLVLMLVLVLVLVLMLLLLMVLVLVVLVLVLPLLLLLLL
jgi:hypothetical protein